MQLYESLSLLLEGAKYLVNEKRHDAAWVMLRLLDETAKSDFGDANAAAISRLKELVETYGRCFARSADGEPAEVSASELADQIKMGVLRLMNSHLEWKRRFQTKKN